MIRSLVFVAFLLAAPMVAANAAPPPYTLDFDELPTGRYVGDFYYEKYGIQMYGWWVMDSVASGWGLPSSGSNVAVWEGPSGNRGSFVVGFDGVDEYAAQSVGAYFSTEAGCVLDMVGYGKNYNVVATAQIGSATDSWTNRFVMIDSALGDIYLVRIFGVSSDDGWCRVRLDDLSVVPIPEPSSLIALLAGLGGVGGMVWRRRSMSRR